MPESCGELAGPPRLPIGPLHGLADGRDRKPVGPDGSEGRGWRAPPGGACGARQAARSDWLGRAAAHLPGSGRWWRVRVAHETCSRGGPAAARNRPRRR